MENELLSLIPEYIPLGLGVYDKDGYLKYVRFLSHVDLHR